MIPQMKSRECLYSRQRVKKREVRYHGHRKERAGEIVYIYAKGSYEGVVMLALRKVYGARIVHLSALLLTLFFSIASLVSCSQPAPLQYTSLNLGIPAAALQSPVKGPLPDKTVLHVGITFKVDPRLLDQADHLQLKPGQRSNLEAFARRIGIDDATLQKIEGFFNADGITLQLSKLRTYLSFQAKAATVARG